MVQGLDLEMWNLFREQPPLFFCRTLNCLTVLPCLSDFPTVEETNLQLGF